MFNKKKVNELESRLERLESEFQLFRDILTVPEKEKPAVVVVVCKEGESPSVVTEREPEPAKEVVRSARRKTWELGNE